MTIKLENSALDLPLLVTAAVVVDNGKVLITKRPADKKHPGYWEFPGGKLNPGEGPEEALTREMLEELGVNVKVGRIFESVYYRYDWGAVLILAYNCTLRSGKISNIEVAEHHWAYPHELSSFKILPADQPIIDRLNNLSD